MKKKGFLKCYYWYKNWWDELLLMWVIPFLFKRYKLEKLYIEVWDRKFVLDFFEKNNKFIKDYKNKIELIPKDDVNKYNIKNCLKFFWWWEVLTDEIEIKPKKNVGSGKKTMKFSRKSKKFLDLSKLDEIEKVDEIDQIVENIKKSKFSKFMSDLLFMTKSFASKYFARAWWNYYLKYYNDIQKWNFVLLWWITKPHKPTTKLLYNLMLPKAKEIVCRDSVSYQLALTYNKKSFLYDDFGRDFLKNESILLKSSNSKYILININSKAFSDENLQKILDFVEKFKNYKKIFFPCDLKDDLQYFEVFKKYIPKLELYNWTEHTLEEILSLFKNAKAWIWTRLHFLISLQYYKVYFEPIVYAEKIYKLINLSGVVDLQKKSSNYFFDKYFVIKLSINKTLYWDNKKNNVIYYLLDWEIELEIEGKKQIIKKPSKIVIYKWMEYKILALSNCILLKSIE